MTEPDIFAFTAPPLVKRIREGKPCHGDCYRFAYDLANAPGMENGEIVHGTVNGYIRHAWFEHDGLAWDWQTHCGHDRRGCNCRQGRGPLPGEPIDAFRARNRVVEYGRYDLDAAAREFLALQSYGPWDFDSDP
jgi:hypothetical protein